MHDDEHTQVVDTTETSTEEPNAGGFLGWFAGHHVAANLLMGFILLAGFLAMLSNTVEVFPEFSVDIVTVQVPYRGASPAETEEGVVVRVEEAIAAIEGIKRIRSTASEGVGAVTIEIDEGADNRKLLDDVKAAVDRIDTFPVETERPIVSEVVNRRQVMSVVLSGDIPLRDLAVLAQRVRDDLTALDDISQAEVKGVPPYEISIELSETAMRRYSLSFTQVADAVRRASLDLPGGSVKTEGGEILLRVEGQRYRGDEFERLVVVDRPDGTELRLGDIATVVDGFEETDVRSRFQGESAALVQVYRTGDEGALEVTAAARDYIETANLPVGVSLTAWQDASVILAQRIQLLVENAALGLLLVFICLAIFLDFRLAFWTTMGIPISFLGGLWLIPHFDVTVNMISLFAFIVSLGIVVDDAIVVGENIFEKRERGMSPLTAAVEGAREMAAPVTFAILTTVAAFMPLVFVEGTLGKVMRSIPLVVIMVLVTSLVESLLILPAHLSGKHRSEASSRRRFDGARRRLEAVQNAVSKSLRRFVDGPYSRLLEMALSWRYLTLAIALTILLVSVGVFAGGWVKFTFMPDVDADNMVAYLRMPQGTPADETEAIAARLADAARRVGVEVDAEMQNGEDSEGAGSIFRYVAVTVGEQPTAGAGGPTSSGSTSGSGSHLAEVNVELQPGDVRGIASNELLARWRQEAGEVPGAVALTFTASLFSAGDALSVELAHRDFDTLLLAAERLQSQLAEFPGTGEISDSFVPGKRELKIDLTDEGQALGVSLADLARQVRQGFYGEEVQRIQRGRDDLRVMVRYPRDERSSQGDIENMRVRLLDGTEVPFATVATVSEGRGYAAINRVDRRRVVTVTGSVDARVANAEEINKELREDVLPALALDFPGLSFGVEGEQRQQSESLESLRVNFLVALVVIFALLAIPFRSYSQPLLVMSAIPFGFVGALGGHMLMGMNMSLLSFFGVVALTGVVVNDSLIMIDLINRERRVGVPMGQAVRDSGKRRFRPILLTTLTTFFGLTPMLLETSLQAQFLIPMAISLSFGVLFATAVTLILVPTLYLILEDLHGLFGSSTIRPADIRAGDIEAAGIEAAGIEEAESYDGDLEGIGEAEPSRA